MSKVSLISNYIITKEKKRKEKVWFIGSRLANRLPSDDKVIGLEKSVKNYAVRPVNI